ncbi:MAG TPA: DUF2723 domain-containing protein [Verrucomicrobiae bacterium]|nr:DUF2723 domain-containing protein [Verrucomicrobiae bacterium]
MSKDKHKTSNSKPPATNEPAPKPAKVASLFRFIDWFTLVAVTLAVFIVYFLTLAPNVTLEDSGELVTGSFYAGIPHPPGYPFWAIYSWFWTFILHGVGSVAWRVDVGEAFAAAAGCGLLAMMVSRGSSMLIEGIEELKIISGRVENAICLVAGFVAGTLMGLDGFMWSESDVINRISLFGVPWLLLVLILLMRWMYAPRQWRYLYLAMFFYGICATIHQTLLLSAMGIEVAIALAQPRMGRTFFMGNSIIYMVCLIELAKKAVPALSNMTQTETVLFHIVGVGSILTYFWLMISTKMGVSELFRDAAFIGIFFFGAIASSIGVLGGLLAVGSLVAWIKLTWDTRKKGLETPVAFLCFVLFVLGISFYFYEAIAGMTDPPMQWGYPRTVQGFFHALSRGQYENIQGTDIFHNPARFFDQLWYIVQGLSESFSWVLISIGLLPFLFLLKMKKRELAWIIGLTAIYFCLAVILVILLNVGLDKSSSDLNKVFFTASHALFAIMLGYGLALIAAYMALHYEKFRFWGLVGGCALTLVALYCLMDATGKLYFGPIGQVSLFDLPHWVKQSFAKDQYGLPVFGGLILLAIPIIFVLALLIYRRRAPLLILLCLFLVMPVYSGMSHWFKSEQRNHWFGYWFGHDMFTPPFDIYPEMTRDAILFGGTDPGRFVPTYMIFCESFIPASCKPMDPKFDRRDVYLITQNALADGTYLDYLRAQYNRSTQHDPPFFSRFFRYTAATIGLGNRDNVIMDLNSEDAGKGDTGNALVEGIANLLYSTLDVPFTKLGASIEKRRRAQGVYPPKEIYIPSPEDSERCFAEYRDDFERRSALGQLLPGEGVRTANNQMSISGQVSVMMINGLLAKVIFDQNPTNEFFVEESFPLQWMYPYETPFGVIMKVNRNPLPELSDDVFKKDHEFWSKFSDRLTGNWITYDTSVKEIADFAEKVYLRNNFAGFKGDRKFIRDEDAQKSFSKLRSSIAGIYAWRLGSQCPPEYRQKTEASRQALIKETDFAFKQAFAFCPYSPEIVVRYIQFLMQFNRVDDAILVTQTASKLDPYNDQFTSIVSQLQQIKEQTAAGGAHGQSLQQMEAEAQNNPTNFQNIFQLAQYYFQTGQTNHVIELFDQALVSPKITANEIGAIAQFYLQTGNLPKLEAAVKRLTQISPNEPEPWYDLASLETVSGKTTEALQDLRASLDLSAARLKTNPAARDLLNEARKDSRFNSLRSLPGFQKLVPAN